MLVIPSNQTPRIIKYLPEKYLVIGKNNMYTYLLPANKANKNDKTLFLESNIGLGYVPSFETYYFVDDVPPYAVTKERWIHLDNRYGDNVYNHSHITIYGDLAMSGGILVGVRF